VLGTFGLTNRQLDGDHKLPEALTVFGSLKVSSISIFHGDEDEGSSYTVQPEGAKLADVAKAAGLKKDGPRFVRKVRADRRSQRAAARHRPARLHQGRWP
jgi:hypothetical protein